MIHDEKLTKSAICFYRLNLSEQYSSFKTFILNIHLGSEAMVKLLIERGGDVNVLNKYNNSTLIIGEQSLNI